METTATLPLAFMAGLLGSAHCLGMCGPFALLVGGSRDWRRNLVRQACYTSGRVFTYGVLGAIAGFGGLRLAKWGPLATWAPAALAIGAGLVLVYQGLKLAGLIPRRRTQVKEGGVCLSGSLLATFLRDTSFTGVFLAGLLTGLLPCGLVYGMLALAASTASLPAGMLLMALFGAGTAPAMMMAGLGAPLLSVRTRRRVFGLAAWCVLFAGVVSVARGVGYLPVHGEQGEAAGCPFCAQEAP